MNLITYFTLALFILPALLGGITAVPMESLSDPGVIYTDVQLANCSDSLRRIAATPVHTYVFKYDSVEGRKQMGVLAREAEVMFPDSIEVMKEHPVISKALGKKIVLSNFPMVDKNVLFMHSFAAVKELIKLYDGMSRDVTGMAGAGQQYAQLLKDLELRLSDEEAMKDSEVCILHCNAKIILTCLIFWMVVWQEARMFQLELQLAERELAADRLREELERNRTRLEMEQERSLLQVRRRTICFLSLSLHSHHLTICF